MFNLPEYGLGGLPALAGFVAFITFKKRSSLLKLRSHWQPIKMWTSIALTISQNGLSLSAICAYTWYRYSQIKTSIITKATTLSAFVIAAGVILSTLLIKQHDITDEIAGVTLAYAVGKPLFNHLWKKPNTANLQLKLENTKT